MALTTERTAGAPQSIDCSSLREPKQYQYLNGCRKIPDNSLMVVFSSRGSFPRPDAERLAVHREKDGDVPSHALDPRAR